jgi:subfamily B ATP-binding cassette protein MsbA
MQGIRDVKLFGLREEIVDDFTAAIDQYRASKIKYHRNQSAIKNFYQLLSAVVIFSLLYIALSFSGLSLGELGVFLFALFRLAPKVSTLNNIVYNIDSDLPHLVRTQQFTDRLKRQREPDTGTRPLPGQVDSVSFEDVTFRYDSTDAPVLHDLSFSVESGEFVAFVGPSGAGKSTIVSLLARLYDPDEGDITANGTSIDQFPITEWRSRLAIVRQDPHVFNTTLRRNLTIGNRDASEEELDRVCEIAQITEFFDELPAGYESQLGDDGVRLSGGQRQRIALARALLKDADLLVLDEATSDLDTGIESDVQREIEEMERDYAMITIAHRLSTVQNADRIYTVESGEITERGNHEELLDHSGTYADLYSSQRGHR